MLDLIASCLVRGLNIFLHVMPIRFNLWLGRRLGAFVYYLSGKRSRIAYSNLKAAFAGEKTPEELKRITKNTYRNMVQTFAELLSMTKVDKRYIDKYVNIINFERVVKASENPKGMILLSAHYGNWELSTVASTIKGFQLHLLARDQKMERLNELLNRLRELKGSVVIRKGTDVKNIFRALHNGKGVGILGDQNAGVNGELIEFFGRPASTAVGPFRLAQKVSAWILPAFIHRVNGPYHDLVLEPIMEIRKDEDIIPYMREYCRLLEKHIREYPDQWLWMHKKWKVTPLKKVLVLDDGKKGHLKQSMAVVKQIRHYRENEGYGPEHLVVDTVKIRFKSKKTKLIFNCLTPFFTTRCQFHLKCLKWALEPESYEAAVNRYADVIVSCGSTLFGVNMVLKLENNARGVTVLDPGILNREKFNLVIVPRHDFEDKRIRERDNIAVIDMAPNLIDREELTRFELKPPEGKKGIGLLLGGENPYFSFGDSLARDISKSVKMACEQLDGYAYITTSRRTPTRAEDIIAGEFKDFSRLGMFVSGRNDRDEHTVEKILAASDIVLVSGESISMISEAVSSGKPVLVFMPDKKSEKMTKYEKFVEELRERGYLLIVKPNDIISEANDIINGQYKPATSDDNRRIYEKLYRLF